MTSVERSDSTGRVGWVDAPCVEVLIPAPSRPAALAVTLTSLLGQTHRPLRALVPPQREEGALAAILRVLRARGVDVVQAAPDELFGRVRAPYALVVTDDLVLEPELVATLLDTLRRDGQTVVRTVPGCALFATAALDLSAR